MNYRMVGRYLGLLVLAEAVFMLPPAFVSWLYGEPHVLLAFLQSAGACLLLGAALFMVGHKASPGIYAREGFVVAGIGWVLISFLGALPFFLSGELPLSDAFFESVAGFTTTGTFSTISIESWTRGLLFWRNAMQWLGGIGVLAFILAVVRPTRGPGASGSLSMFRAESPGPQAGKFMPRVRDGVRFLFIIYAVLSGLCLLLLLAGGMSLFDALCTTFGVAGTGGFGVYHDGMASYSTYIQIVCAVFMVLFGVNFTLYYLLWRKNWREALRNEELRLYLSIFAGAVLLITGSLYFTGFGGFGHSLHHAGFMSASVISSTGLSMGEYEHWPEFARSVLFILMIIGAMGGSTAGGFKVGRLLILLKSLRAGLHRLLHPRSVTTLRMNGKPLGEEVLWRTQLYLFVYCGILLLSTLLISVDGMPLTQNLSAVFACIGNIGPGFGLVTSFTSFGGYSLFSKFILALNMLLGRLEIFPILILFFPATWRAKA